MTEQVIHDGETIPDVEKKDPDSQISHGFDYSDWLRAGEYIIESTWSYPAGLLLGDDGGTPIDPDFSNTVTSIMLRGGESNARYRVTNTIKTNLQQKEQRSFHLLVGDK